MPDAPKLPASPLAGGPDASLASSHLEWRRALRVLSGALLALGLLSQAIALWSLSQARAQAAAHGASMSQPLSQQVLVGIALYGPALLLGGVGLTMRFGSGRRSSQWGLVASFLTGATAAVAAVGYFHYAEDHANPPAYQTPGLVGTVGCTLVVLLPLGSHRGFAKPVRGLAAVGIMAPLVTMCAVIITQAPIHRTPWSQVGQLVLTLVPVLVLPIVGGAALLWLIIREPGQGRDVERPEGRHA